MLKSGLGSILSISGLATVSMLASPKTSLAQSPAHARVKYLGSDQQHRLQLLHKEAQYLPELFLRQEEQGNPLKLERKNSSKTNNESLRLSAGQLERDDYIVKLHGKEVRGFYLTEVYKDGALIQGLGKLPEDHVSFPSDPESASWLPQDDWQKIIADSFIANGNSSPEFTIEKGQEVFWYDGQSRIIPTTEITLNFQGKQYLYQISAQGVHAREALYFHADGKALVYPENPVESTLTEVTIKDLNGNGRLETQYLKSSPQQHSAANSATHQFVYDVDDYRFQETNAFVHLKTVYDWFVGLGYKWHTSGSLYLYAHENERSDDANNAYYQPNAGNPKIRIGVGDGSALQNLSLDMDVVSHEFGHHIIFQYIQTTRNEESLILHEGLADFFTFARSGDACLGESICPSDSPYCEVRGQCLRTADNDLNYEDYTFTQLMPHQKGQIISGLLWDLKGSQNLNISKVTTLTFKAISFLPQESIFEDFFLSLLTADHELNKGQFSCAIVDAFKNRGFGVFADEVDCEALDYSQYIDSTGKIDSGAISGGRAVARNQNSGTSTPATSASKRSKSSGCGSVGAASILGSNLSSRDSSGGLDSMFLLILGMPLILTLTRRRS